MSKPTTVEDVLVEFAKGCGNPTNFLTVDEAKAALASVILACVPEGHDWFNRRELEWREKGHTEFTTRDSAMYDQGFNACREQVLKNLQEVLG